MRSRLLRPVALPMWRLPALHRLALCLLPSLAACATAVAEGADQPPRFELPAPKGAPLRFVVYGDTRFTTREHVAHANARRALVEKIAAEQPAAILVGGDLVYEGRDPEEYRIYKSETADWAARKIAVFPALAQDVEPKPTCNHCSAVYIPKSELDGYNQRAIEHKLVDQQVRSVDVGKVQVGIGSI